MKWLPIWDWILLEVESLVGYSSRPSIAGVVGDGAQLLVGFAWLGKRVEDGHRSASLRRSKQRADKRWVVGELVMHGHIRPIRRLVFPLPIENRPGDP